jgi:ribosomal protein S18 acetylase RimI-like enzyme
MLARPWVVRHFRVIGRDETVCNALGVDAVGDVRIAQFDPSMQDAFRVLVLDGMAERWGAVDASLNPDLDDVATHYGRDCVLVALDGERIVGTGILVLRTPEGEIVRMSVHREYRRLGIAKRLLIALVGRAAECGLDRVVVETNAKWKEARKLYEGSGFTRTHTRAGPFGREVFYGLVI